eukprot:scaffold25905_cov118-Isochrysis_galbana.AAC.3
MNTYLNARSNTVMQFASEKIIREVLRFGRKHRWARADTRLSPSVALPQGARPYTQCPWEIKPLSRTNPEGSQPLRRARDRVGDRGGGGSLEQCRWGFRGCTVSTPAPRT